MISINALKPGLTGMLEFAAFLKSNKIIYSIHHYSYDGFTIFFSTIGARFEVLFTEEDWSFSYFPGNEDFDTDKNRLIKLINEHWSED
jgi:hypothetical protein